MIARLLIIHWVQTELIKDLVSLLTFLHQFLFSLHLQDLLVLEVILTRHAPLKDIK